MIHILGICGSPIKDSNTELMLGEALKAIQNDEVRTDLFSLYDKQVEDCRQCNWCMMKQTENNFCAIKDDMQQLYPLMEEADAIVFGSPVYFHGVTAQAKAIIDRTFCYLPKHPLKGKVGAPVLALRRVGAGQTRVHVYGWLISQGMVPVKGAIGYGREKGDVRTGVGGGIDVTALDEARETGRDVISMLKQLSSGG